MSEQPTGRVRGRARGRARGTQQEPPRRPGQVVTAAEAQVKQTESLIQPSTSQSSAVCLPASERGDIHLPAHGRTITRGGIRSDRPGGESLISGMRDLQIGPDGEKSLKVSMGSHRKLGEAGQPVNLYSNHILLKSLPKFLIYHYHVSFHPEIESTQLRKAILRTHKDRCGEVCIYDGMSLYTTQKLEKDEFEFASKRNDSDMMIRIRVKFATVFPPVDPQFLNIVNLLIRRIFSEQKYTLLGRNYYNSSDAIVIQQHKVEVWPGYITATHQYQNDVMMTIDVSHKILRINTAYDEMASLGSLQRGDIKDACIKSLVGNIVLTRYNNRNYKIEDIDWSVNPGCTFDYKGSQITYIEYYKKNYGVTIKEANQPMLVIRHKKREIRGGQSAKAYLVPELCVMTGLTDNMRTDFKAMKEIADYTRVNPQVRYDQIRRFLDKLNSSEITTATLHCWGLKFDSDLVKLKARQLDPERIWQGTRSYSYRPDSADWTASLRDSPVKCPVVLEKWVLIFYQQNTKLADDFVRSLISLGTPMGMRISRPHMICLSNDQAHAYTSAITANCQDTQLIVCMVQSMRKDRYDLIKKLCCVELGIPSQVIVYKSLQKNLRSVATKIAIQINCKLGGEVWSVEIPFKEKLMVVGIDSYHDSQQKGRSVGGLVASMNSECTRYYTRIAFQSTHQELLDNLHVLFSGALKHYFDINKVIPSRIIVYRDGVGDGQLPIVQDYEVPQILSCFNAIGTDYRPKFTYIVVNKRINTRFFSIRDRLNNPLPGTIIDDVVTRPDRYDFFIVPQNVRQGTVTPTQFNVVYDDRGPRADHIQRLTYKMCHLYYNWSGTIRVPAPCQYAHKVAFLIGQCVHEKPHDRLADTLFFL